jgi:hypothetical protein
MSKSWIRNKRPEFMRDVLRDFCLASVALEVQFGYFDASGRLQFEYLRDLLGEERNKGLLWRLKDTSHHLFRDPEGERTTGPLLDWALGYVFHETIKLKEDAYQQETYAPRFQRLVEGDLPAEVEGPAVELGGVLNQTRESIRREIDRIRFILHRCLELFPLYLEPHKRNMLLARLLYEQEELVSRAFGDRFEDLLLRLYGDEPELRFTLASQSLRQGGWVEEASKAMAVAEERWADRPSVAMERQILANWQRRLLDKG